MGQETQKYTRERQFKALDYNSELGMASRGIDARKKQPGDLSDANAEYNSALDLADKKRQVDKNQDAYDDAVNSANVKRQRAVRAADEAEAGAEQEDEVTGIKDSSSLKLRLLGVGKTPENAGSTIGQEYQIRVQAAADEMAATGDVKKLRADIATAWADKIVGTAEHEKQLADKQKQDRIELIQSEGEFKSKLSAANSNPQDQFSAIRDAYRERLDIALQIYAVDQKSDDLKKRSLQAEHDMEISIADLRKKGIEEYEQIAGKVYDALLSKRDKGNAFRQLLLGQVEGVGKKAFTNLAGLTYGSFEKLGVGNLVPGQYEKNPDGSPKIDPKTGNPTLTMAGKVLQGGPLGVNQAKLAGAGINPGVHATQLNTTSTDRNTQAIDRLTARVEAILGVKSGQLSSAIHSLGGANTSSVMFSGGSGVSFPNISTGGGYGLSPSITSSIVYDGGGADSYASGGGFGSPGYGGITGSGTDPFQIPGYLDSVYGGGGSVNPLNPAAVSMGADSGGYSGGGMAPLPTGPAANTAPAPALSHASTSAGSIAGPLFNGTSTAPQMAMSAIASAGALYAGTMGA